MTSAPDTRYDEPAAQRLPGVEPPHSWDRAELASLVEAFLLVAPEPPTLPELASGAGTTTDDILAAIELLAERDDRGWMVQRHGDRVHLATAPRYAPLVRTFLGLDREARLSAAAMEVLAIVAYRQPVTRTEIEAVRGVDCSGVLATLHARALIEPVSRRPTVGNPIQYGTSIDFLRHFGLRTLDDLPPIGQIDGLDGIQLLDEVASPADEDAGAGTADADLSGPDAP